MSDLLTRLIAAGTPADLIAEVAMLAARAEVDREAIESRRAKDRERQNARRGNVTSRDTQDVTDETPSLEVPPQTPLPNPTPTRNENPRARKADPFPRPEWADPGVWADLLTNRRKKNLPNTASAHRKLLADIDRLTDEVWPPGRVLEAAVSRGWGAIYAGCKDDDDGRTNGNANRGSGGRMVGSGPSATLRIRQAAAAAEREDAENYQRSWPSLPAAGHG